jgi:hypothetical protein
MSTGSSGGRPAGCRSCPCGRRGPRGRCRSSQPTIAAPTATRATCSAPPYPWPTDTLEKNPKRNDALTKVTATLTVEKVRELNGKVDPEKEGPKDVAHEYLQEEGNMEQPYPKAAPPLEEGLSAPRIGVDAAHRLLDHRRPALAGRR